jgi:hypothetical protein
VCCQRKVLAASRCECRPKHVHMHNSARARAWSLCYPSLLLLLVGVTWQLPNKVPSSSCSGSAGGPLSQAARPLALQTPPPLFLQQQQAWCGHSHHRSPGGGSSNPWKHPCPPPTASLHMAKCVAAAGRCAMVSCGSCRVLRRCLSRWHGRTVVAHHRAAAMTQQPPGAAYTDRRMHLGMHTTCALRSSATLSGCHDMPGCCLSLCEQLHVTQRRHAHL